MGKCCIKICLILCINGTLCLMKGLTNNTPQVEKHSKCGVIYAMIMLYIFNLRKCVRQA